MTTGGYTPGITFTSVSHKFFLQKQALESAILNGGEDGLEIIQTETTGRGIFARRQFAKGEFVVEHCGDLLELKEAKQREAEYAKDETIGSYMYFFWSAGGRPYWLDSLDRPFSWEGWWGYDPQDDRHVPP